MPIDSGFSAGESAIGLLRNSTSPFEATTVQTLDGASLHVRSYGPADAPIVVLSHGFCARIEYWNPQINNLAGRYRLVAYDQRGLGRSTSGSRPVRPDVLGDDLSAVLAATVSEGRRAVVVGHSFGGISVMSWAKRHASDVSRYASSILLANTVAERFGAHTAILPFAGSYSGVRRPALTTIARARIPLAALPFARKLVRDIALTPDAPRDQVTFVLAMVGGVDPRIRTAWGAGLLSLDVIDGLNRIDVPTTVLVGSLDRITPMSASQQIAGVLETRGLLHSYVALQGVGHCSNIEVPAAFDAEIDKLVTLGA